MRIVENFRPLFNQFLEITPCVQFFQVVSKDVMLSEAKHLYNALKCELGFFAMLRMTIGKF